MIDGQEHYIITDWLWKCVRAKYPDNAVSLFTNYKWKVRMIYSVSLKNVVITFCPIIHPLILSQDILPYIIEWMKYLSRHREWDKYHGIFELANHVLNYYSFYSFGSRLMMEVNIIRSWWFYTDRGEIHSAKYGVGILLRRLIPEMIANSRTFVESSTNE